MMIRALRSSAQQLKSQRIILASFSTAEEPKKKVSKVVRKSSPKDKAAGSSKKDGQLDNVIRFYESAEKARKTKIEFSEEEQAEHERIAKNFQIEFQRRENRYNKDLTTKIWLMNEAVASLPDNLKAQAVIIDETPPPQDRPVVVYETPPVKGFDSERFSKGNGSEQDESNDGTALDEYVDPASEDGPPSSWASKAKTHTTKSPSSSK